MLLSRLKVATVWFLAAGVVASTAGLVMLPVLAFEPPQPPSTARPATPDGGKGQTTPKLVVIQEDASVTQLAWSPDGKVVATVGINWEPIEWFNRAGKNPKTLLFPISTVKLWDASTGKLKQSLGAEKKTDPEMTP